MIKFKILTQNFWGIPYVSKRRKERVNALANEIIIGEYDLVALQEVWSEDDYTFLVGKISQVMPHSHYFYNGVIGSGLCVFSKGEILNALIMPYSLNGEAHKFWHGDWFGGKCATLSIIKFDFTLIYFYLTHTIAKYSDNWDLKVNTSKNHPNENYIQYYYATNDIYAIHRLTQILELANFIIMTYQSLPNQKYNAYKKHILFLAGDLNLEQDELPYKLLISLTGLQDAFSAHSNENSINDECTVQSTFCHPLNSFTPPMKKNKKKRWRLFKFISMTSILNECKKVEKGTNQGQRIDYILYKTSHSNKKSTCLTSLSDHEGVIATFELKEGSIPNPLSEHAGDNFPVNQHPDQGTNSCNVEKNDLIETTLAIFKQAVEKLFKETRYYKMIALICLFVLYIMILYQDQTKHRLINVAKN